MKPYRRAIITVCTHALHALPSESALRLETDPVRHAASAPAAAAAPCLTLEVRKHLGLDVIAGVRHVLATCPVKTGGVEVEREVLSEDAAACSREGRRAGTASTTAATRHSWLGTATLRQGTCRKGTPKRAARHTRTHTSTEMSCRLSRWRNKSCASYLHGVRREGERKLGNREALTAPERKARASRHAAAAGGAWQRAGTPLHARDVCDARCQGLQALLVHAHNGVPSVVTRARGEGERRGHSSAGSWHGEDAAATAPPISRLWARCKVQVRARLNRSARLEEQQRVAHRTHTTQRGRARAERKWGEERGVENRRERPVSISQDAVPCHVAMLAHAGCGGELLFCALAQRRVCSGHRLVRRRRGCARGAFCWRGAASARGHCHRGAPQRPPPHPTRAPSPPTPAQGARARQDADGRDAQ